MQAAREERGNGAAGPSRFHGEWEQHFTQIFSGIVCLKEQTGLQSAIREISIEHLTLNHFEPMLNWRFGRMGFTVSQVEQPMKSIKGLSSCLRGHPFLLT